MPKMIEVDGQPWMVCDPGYADEPFEVAEKLDILRSSVTVRDANTREAAKLAAKGY